MIQDAPVNKDVNNILIPKDVEIGDVRIILSELSILNNFLNN